MKKGFGWFLLITNSMFLLATLAMIVLTVSQDHQQMTESLLTFAISLLVHALFFFIGFFLIKKKKEIPVVPYTKEFHFSLQGIIPYTHYRHAILSLMLLRPLYLFFIVGACLLVILYALHQIEIAWVAGLVITVVISPVLALIKIKKMYTASAILNQSVLYDITNESIHIKGSHVDSNIKWPHYVKIHEVKHFFFLYPNPQTATLISKAFFTPSQLMEFKRFLRSLPIEKKLTEND